MRDLRNNIASIPSIVAEALDADNTEVTVDLRGFDGAAVEITVGVGGITFTGSNKVEFKLTDSDDDSTYAAVEDADVDLTESNISTVGTGGIVYSLIAAHAAGTAVNIGYTGGKRYLQLLADFSGTHGSATPIAANVIKALPHDAPTA
jgi:hypothetical protein